MSYTPASTCILLPQHSCCELETERGIATLERYGFDVIRVVGRSAVDYARSELVSLALKTNAKQFLWIDSDIVFKAEHAFEILKHEKPFICAAYALPKLRKLSIKLGAFGTEFAFGAEGTLIPIEACGFGFVLTHRSIFEALDRVVPDSIPHRHYFQPSVKENEAGKLVAYTEDFSFCFRATQVGFDLFCDTKIVLGHVGRKVYTVFDLV